MSIRTGVVLSAIAAVSLAAGPALAQFDELAIGVKAGTLGVGGELTTDLLSGLNLRGSLQWLDLSLGAEFEGIDYDAHLKFFNPLVLLDWYPFGGAFRISGGALFNGSEVDLEATSNQTIELDGTTYTPSEYGTLRGEADFQPIAPYVGIGFGNPLKPDQHWELSLDLGVAFIGATDVTLSATGPIASNSTFQQQLAQEERDIEDTLHKFQFYPVLSLTLTYHF